MTVQWQAYCVLLQRNQQAVWAIEKEAYSPNMCCNRPGCCDDKLLIYDLLLDTQHLICVSAASTKDITEPPVHSASSPDEE